ncbi:transposase family protein [Spiroplasma endosymbiont of Asaphidion curtum]|uniref:transposase family protein n=1 Tax=Spiroplasma endosymbiont of Asaphidion curtum TaxID=3066281 RepID=UPI00313D0EE8
MLDKYKDENEFYSLIGIKYKTFMKMVEILKEAEAKQKQIGGRPNKLSIEQRLLMTLEYWKEYSTYRIIAKNIILVMLVVFVISFELKIL